MSSITPQAIEFINAKEALKKREEGLRTESILRNIETLSKDSAELRKARLKIYLLRITLLLATLTNVWAASIILEHL